MFKYIYVVIWICVNFQQLHAQHKPDPVGTVYVTRQTPVHDPVLIKEKSTYYLFCTGFGINVFSSKDLKTWKKENPVFKEPPTWAMRMIPSYKGHTWAPDVSYHNGKYYLFYAVSAFGKNTSCIGLAVNNTLDPSCADFKWIDRGLVIQSLPGRDDWNAIDPTCIFDEKNTPWMAFGSFWSGIKIFKLDTNLTKPAEPQLWYSIASRKRIEYVTDTAAGGNAIEAPFIYKKNSFYYLFVSWDYCCKGINSNYKVVVGRSKNVFGPYTDKNNIPLTQNGGTVIIEGNKDWYGIGHNAVFTDDDGTDYFIAHGYDAQDNGRSKLIIKKITWKEGWPNIENN